MNCNRCNQKTNCTTMSMFNTDTICMSCKKIEQKHPDYQLACDTELAEVKKGNNNFRGIGLPKDYHSFIKQVNK